MTSMSIVSIPGTIYLFHSLGKFHFFIIYIFIPLFFNSFLYLIIKCNIYCYCYYHCHSFALNSFSFHSRFLLLSRSVSHDNGSLKIIFVTIEWHCDSNQYNTNSNQIRPNVLFVNILLKLFKFFFVDVCVGVCMRVPHTESNISHSNIKVSISTFNLT